MPLNNFLTNPDIFNYRLLFQLISPLSPATNINDLINSPETSWESLLNMANTYLMTPALWAGLVQKSIDAELDNDLCDYMQELYTLNEARNQGLKNQAIEAINVLNKAGIVPLLIKGAVQLFHPLHADFGTRIMTDLDMVIPEDKIRDAMHALKVHGYEEQDRTEKDWHTHHHEVPLGRLGDYGTIELHRRALGQKAESVLSTDDIWAGAECHTYNNEETTLQYHTPNLTHAVLIGFLHSQVAQSDYRKVKIDYKGLYDAAIMIHGKSSRIDWKEIRSRITAHGLYVVFRTYLWTANRLFHLPMPNGIQPHLSSTAYHALCLATIRWQWVDACLELFFDTLDQFRARYGPLRQLFSVKSAFRKK